MQTNIASKKELL